MRCECCDKLLTPVEATAKFIDNLDGGVVINRYVNMCKECTSWLPSSVRILNRSDLENSKEYDDIDNEPDYFDLGDYDE